MKKIGIDAMSYYVPDLYLDLEDLAEDRNISYAKLNKGLGLKHMAVPDVHEDAASFAANALLSLIKDNGIDPRKLGRIYLGTESALDASKPTSTYALEAVESILENEFGPRCFKNCDVLDMTFACVGAVDALHNCFDWVKAGDKREAVVIASDIAKYDLCSTGEYTQGAGSVALLIKEKPSILTISDKWGVATQGVGDFFKPRRVFNKRIIFRQTANLLGVDLAEEKLDAILNNLDCEFWSTINSQFEIFKEEPVFDGQYSNECYKQRITEALNHFTSISNRSVLSEWKHIVFHLPYAYQARRMFVDIWMNFVKGTELEDRLFDDIAYQKNMDIVELRKRVSKSDLYLSYVDSVIAKGELASSLIGNMYTASIFMSLLSLLSKSADEGVDLSGENLGFIAYGSGSKSKVFEAVVEPGWKEKISQLELFDRLSKRKRISVEIYEQLHKNEIEGRCSHSPGIRLSEIYEELTNMGFRVYRQV